MNKTSLKNDRQKKIKIKNKKTMIKIKIKMIVRGIHDPESLYKDTSYNSE